MRVEIIGGPYDGTFADLPAGRGAINVLDEFPQPDYEATEPAPTFLNTRRLPIYQRPDGSLYVKW